VAEPVIQPAQTPSAPFVDSPLLSGPAKSERLGIALAIDLGSQDLALAVSRQNRMPRASVVVTSAARTIIRLSKAGEKVESIVVHGSTTDPTLHPEFREIATNLRDLRNKWFAKAKLCIVSEDPHFESPEVRHSIAVFDKIFLRMEWGTAKTFAAMTGRKSTDLANLTANLGHLENIIVQARFVRGDADNTTEGEVKAWVKRLVDLKPREVHIQSPDAKSLGKKVRPAPKSRLAEIAAEVTEKSGIPVTVLASDSPLI
jgi:hypothetical protein